MLNGNGERELESKQLHQSPDVHTAEAAGVPLPQEQESHTTSEQEEPHLNGSVPQPVNLVRSKSPTHVEWLTAFLAN